MPKMPKKVCLSHYEEPYLMIVDILVHMYKRMISPISSSFSFYQDSDFFKKLEGGGIQVEYFFKVGADFRATLK